MMRIEAHTDSTALFPLTARLIRVATPSVLLAACGMTPPHGGYGGYGGHGGHGGGAGAPTDSGSAGTTGVRDLPPPPPGGFDVDGGPVTGYPQCYDRGQEGLSGPCCLHVRCIEPPDAGVECKPASEIVARDFGFASFGSGTCLCNVPGHGGQVTGLYTPATAQPYSPTEGSCCYLVPYRGCVGRPLILHDRETVAPLAYGSGWV